MSVKLHLSNLNADVSKTHDMQTGSTRNPSPYDVGERKSNEAGDIYETLELLLNFLGGAYSELSGHAAAAQRVVSDLRRSLSFLNSRAGAESAPEQWARPSSAPSPGLGTPSAKTAGEALADAATTPLAQIKTGLIETPGDASARPRSSSRPSPVPTTNSTLSTPIHSSGPSRPSSTGRTRPSSTAYAQGNTPSPGAGAGGGPASSSTQRLHGRLVQPGASILQHRAGSTTHAAHAAHAAHATHGRRSASTERPMLASRTATTAAAASSNPPCRANNAAATPLPSSSATTRTIPAHGVLSGDPFQATPSSALPPPQQPPGTPPGPAATAGPLQLPLNLRRALHRYQEAVQRHDAFLAHAQQGIGWAADDRGAYQGSGGTEALANRPISHFPDLQHVVADSGDAFCRALDHQFGATGPGAAGDAGGAAGGGVGTGAGGSPEARKHHAQVVFATLVAANTWLLQALKELALQGRTSSGVSVTCIAQLMSDLQALKAQLRQALAAAAASQPSSAREGGRGGGGGAQGGSAGAQEDQGRTEAAARWRNRFLRTLIAEGGGRGGGGAARGSRPSPHRPGSASGSASGSRAANQGSGGGGDGGSKRGQGRASSPLMPRPLGVWLPDECWSLVQVPSPSTAPSHSMHGQPQQPQPPWFVLQPQQVAAAGGRAGALHRGQQPLVLHAASVKEAVSHARSQSQLQFHLLQLWLESQLASALIPSRPVPGCNATQVSSRPGSGKLPGSSSQGYGGAMGGYGRSQQQQGELSVEAQRHLARCRLAHVMVYKNAWNKVCCIVEEREEEREH